MFPVVTAFPPTYPSSHTHTHVHHYHHHHDRHLQARPVHICQQLHVLHAYSDPQVWMQVAITQMRTNTYLHLRLSSSHKRKHRHTTVLLPLGMKPEMSHGVWGYNSSLSIPLAPS